MKQHTKIFHALADESRMRIVSEIGPHERPVGALVSLTGMRQSGVSRHLRILESAGVVRVRPEAQRRLYSLRKEAFDALDEWVSQYRRHWDRRLDRLGNALERKKKTSRASRENSK